MYYVIVNPASKSGHGREIWADLQPILEKNKIPYKVIFSKGVGHVTQAVHKLCFSLSDKREAAPIKLIILGGDGTINEALQGIEDFGNVWIGYIPTGSSNDLARDLGLSKDPAVILHRILEGNVVRTMDLGTLFYEGHSDKLSSLCNGPVPMKRHFSVSSGIGFDAAVCEEALTSRFKKFLNKLRLGKLTYLIIALKQLIFAKTVACDIFLEENETPVHIERFFFTAFMIHKYEGGGFKFCPDADSSDGLLNLCVIGNLPKAVLLFALPTAFWGKHYIFPKIEHYTAKKIRIKTSASLWVHTDGEVYRQSDDITITCTANKINLMM